MDKHCGSCGARGLAPFQNETFEIEHHGRTTVLVGLSGVRCGACGEVLFDADSAQRYAAASDELVLAARESERTTIKRIRLKLRLTQEHAAFLTGGGPNAFSRYETGKARPMAAVVHLFRLLDSHPELLSELPTPPAKKRRAGTSHIKARTLAARRQGGKKLHARSLARRGGADPAT